jgi:hypothetical protein
MTEREAKELCLEVWRYLAEHPETARKSDLPKALYARISSLQCECPLCEVCSCDQCPLYTKQRACSDEGEPYARWNHARTPGTRRKAAKEIVQRVEAWEVEA